MRGGHTGTRDVQPAISSSDAGYETSANFCTKYVNFSKTRKNTFSALFYSITQRATYAECGGGQVINKFRLELRDVARTFKGGGGGGALQVLIIMIGLTRLSR